MLSSENVRPGDSPRLGAYFVVIVFFTIYTYQSARTSNLIRQVTNHGVKPKPREEHYTILARHVPSFVTVSSIMSSLAQDLPDYKEFTPCPVEEGRLENVPTSLASVYLHGSTVFLTFRTNALAADFLASHIAQFGILPSWICCCIARKPTSRSKLENIAKCDAARTSATGLDDNSSIPSYSTPPARIVFSQSTVSALGLDQWARLQWAPPPDDIVWNHLATKGWERGVRWVVMSTILSVIILTLIFPLTVVQPAVQAVADEIFSWFRINPDGNLRQLLTKYLPTLLALIINAGIIPELIEAQAVLEGHYKRSAATRGCLRKEMFFLFAAIVAFPALGIIGFELTFETLVQRLAPEAAIELVAREVLSAQAPYFIRYITHAVRCWYPRA